MNLVLLRRQARRVVLPKADRRARHIMEVLRRTAPGPGDAGTPQQPIAVGVVGGPVGEAVLHAVGDDSITLVCDWAPKVSVPQLLPVDVLVGLARPETCRKVLRELSALGVRSVTFVLCKLSERSYSTSKLWRDGEWVRHLSLGAEQAFRTRLPAVHHCSSLRRALAGLGAASPLLARSAPAPLPFAGPTKDPWPATRFYCHDTGDGSTPSLFSASLPACPGDAAIAFGPERGWSDGELHLFETAGWTAAHMVRALAHASFFGAFSLTNSCAAFQGPQIFRTETASVVGSCVLAGRVGLLDAGFEERRRHLRECIEPD